MTNTIIRNKSAFPLNPRMLLREQTTQKRGCRADQTVQSGIASAEFQQKGLDMEDKKIIDLFFSRSEQALTELAKRYGSLLHSVAAHILSTAEDQEECVNDAYLGTWNSIPPQRPDYLKAYVCRITRNCALKRSRYNSAERRCRESETALEELEESLSGTDLEQEWAARELGRELNLFLSKLSREDRTLFLRRYWFSDSVKEIASQRNMTENAVSVRLLRLRGKLKKHLEEQGFQV